MNMLYIAQHYIFRDGKYALADLTKVLGYATLLLLDGLLLLRGC